MAANTLFMLTNDGHGNATPAGEPMGRIGKQRRKGGRTAETDEQAVGERVLPERRSRRGGDVPEGETEGADDDRQQDAETIGQPPQQDSADAETNHRQGVRKRGVRARNAKFRLHCRQRHDHGPHADSADGRKNQREHQSRPRVSGIHPAMHHAVIVLSFVHHRSGLCLKYGAPDNSAHRVFRGSLSEGGIMKADAPVIGKFDSECGSGASRR